ncbi:MAG: iron-containing alcohol dehydrogenase [Coriobacteriales bacterium]|jgi:alcohol dehydrogenase
MTTPVATYSRLVPSLFGKDAMSKMVNIAKDSGKKKAFIICDQGVMMSGGAERVSNAFKEGGLETFVYDDVQPDPSDEVVDKAGDKAKEVGADVIVGVGGGSSMDTAKGVSVLMCNPGSIVKYMEENGAKDYKLDVPVYLIPTAAGTGSEGSPMCVVHELASDIKKTVIRYADLAVLDPTMTFTCPASVTVNSGLDALAHAVEGLTSNIYNPWSTTLSEEAVRIVANNLETCVREPENYEARAKMLYAANAAGDGLANLSVHVGHCFGHELGMQFHLNHGYACGIALPEVIEFSKSVSADAVRDIAECIGIKIPAGLSSDYVAHWVSDWMRDLMKRLEVPSLKDRGITREQTVGIAQAAIDHCPFLGATPGGLTVEQMQEFCGNVYDNYQ